MSNNTVIIAGGGIGGLSLALTLQQIGVPCVVCEAATEMKPLGVGINLQPNAVRELLDLGIEISELNSIGVQIGEWSLVGQNGHEIYAETRGLEAGYHWPQYAVHRGAFQMLLYQRFQKLTAGHSLHLGHRMRRYQTTPDGSVRATFDTAEGERVLEGALLIGADGIHSATRAQMHPTQPPIHWGGALMWRGTTWSKPLRTGASFIGLGSNKQRMVIYPISQPDPDTGLILTNWIAEVTYEDTSKYDPASWFAQVTADSVLPHFTDWQFEWLDVPAMIAGADTVFENPMIDRDPVPTWVHGTTALLGDAAHAMYPTGSNGASQAVIDARTLGSKILEHGVGADALSAYNEALHGPVSNLILRNRSAGPFGLLNIVDERCGGEFENIDDIVPKAERDAFMAQYKSAAGFSRDALNQAPQTIATDARVC